MKTFERELKRYKYAISHIAEPLSILGLVLLIVLPTIAVLNLSPKFVPSSNENVMGVNDNPILGVVLVGGTHNYITQESLTFPLETTYAYKTVLNNREKGIYSKPVIILSNGSSDEKVVKVNATTKENLNSEVSLKYSGMMASLISKNGASVSPVITIPANTSYTIYLEVDNAQRVGYNQELEITFSE